MRKDALFFLALLLTLAAAPVARADIPELQGAWHLDSNGASSPDNSGHGLNATKVGSPTAVSPARFGNGLKFPTESDYLNAGNHAGLQPAHVSVLAWVRSPSTPPTVKGIVSQGASGSCSYSSYSLYTGGSAMADIGTRFYVHTAGGTVKTTAVNNAGVWNNQWHLLTGTYDGTTARIYIDGNLAGSGTGPAGPIAYGLGLNNDFIIGGALDPACVEQTNFNGDTDEVRVYNRALSAEEIAYLARPDHTSPPELPIPTPPPPPPAGRNTQKPGIQTGGLVGGLRSYSCLPGAWADITGSPFTYTWWRRNTQGVTGTTDTKVQSGTNAVFNLPKADVGKTFYCEVTATGLNGQPVSVSTTARILTGQTDAVTSPTSTSLPPPYGNLKIDGIDVFQVTQPNLRSPRFPTPQEDSIFATCGQGTPTDYKLFNGSCIPFDDDPQKVDYRGVTLDARKRTYALVYLSTESQTPYPQRLVDVSLDVTAGGGSVGGSWGLRFDPRIQALHYVTRAQRLDPTTDSAMVFELDPSWLAEAVRRGGKFNVSAFAQIGPGLEGILDECQGGKDCRSDDRFEVQNVPVEDDLPDLTIKTVPMLTPLQRTTGAEIGAGYVLASPEQVLARTRQLFPGGDRMNILPYKTILQIPLAEVLISISPYCQGFDTVRACREAYVDATLDEYLARTLDFGFYDILVAVHHYHTEPGGPLDGGWSRRNPIQAGTLQPLLLVEDGQATDGSRDRPILGVAHEFGHAMGAPHSDTIAPDPVSGRRCGGGANGQDAEPWPDDNTGRLQSAAYDNGKLRMDSFDTPMYDLMSYCAGFDDPNAWISAFNWTRAFDTMKAYARGALRTRALRARATSKGDGFVSGVIGTKGASIVRVVPPSPENNPPAPDPTSPVQIRALDAGGKTLAVMGAKVTRSTEAGTGSFVVGIPRGAATVELLANGQVADRKAKSKPPKVSVSSPRGGSRVGGGARSRLTVRWKASDPDKDALSAVIEFSPNGSSGWRPVYTGSNSGRAVVPGRFLEHANRARIRVKISDGFNETTAVSRPFRADGTPPTARIVLPATSKLAAPGRILLQGTGVDDRNRVLKGRSLTWFAGKRRLGRGDRLRARLPGGNVTLRLQVRDRFGRVTTAVRRLKITPKQLQIRTLSGPAHVAKGARSMKVTVKTTVPATLSAGGKRFSISGKTRRLTIPLPRKPATGVLKVKFSVTAKGVKQRALRQLITVLRS